MGWHDGGNYVVPRRPKITYESGTFLHNQSITRIVLRRDVISVGCTDVTVEALRALLRKHDEKFAKQPEEYVVQE